jgi:hypothetical protein
MASQARRVGGSWFSVPMNRGTPRGGGVEARPDLWPWVGSGGCPGGRFVRAAAGVGPYGVPPTTYEPLRARGKYTAPG